MKGVRHGSGCVAEVSEVVAQLGGRRVLLVCGRRSFEASGAARVLGDLERAAEVRRWSDFAPNTDAADLAEGLKVMADFRPDTVLGVGGGSAMDMAKLLCAFHGTGDADKLAEAIRSGGLAAPREPWLVLVPTTSGSGSEATHFAVVYIGDDKYSVADPTLLPDVAILDPDLTLSGSAHQRATSGIDAVSQAVESLWAAGATDESRRFARRALRMLIPAIESFVKDPAGGAAGAMCTGSHLAGRAINITKTTAAHALSYGLTKGYGVSHGHAVALTLGAFIEAHARAKPDLLQPEVDPEQHEEALGSVLEALGAADPGEARRRFIELGESLGLPMRLAGVGVTSAAQVRRLVESVNVERLGNNPVRFTMDELTELVLTAV